MSINNVQSPSCSDVNMAVVKEENTDIDEYHSIFAKLKKLQDILKTNEKPESGDGGQADDNKLAPKRKSDLDFDGLSDDSALNSTNKTKRRRFSDSQDCSIRDDFNIRDYCNNTSGNGEKKYILSISNLPGEWTYEKIKQYVNNECGVSVLKMTDSRSQKSNYQLRLKFTNEEQYKRVLSELQNKEMEGKLKLKVEEESDTDSGDDSDTTHIIGKSEVENEDSSWISNIDVWDPKGLYGLKPEFLKYLNIVPPLGKWINVTNFRCDKSELRDVFEMAGRVVICVVIHNVNKYANIMYSHPLEAVQAVSMFNGQIFYGQSLKVIMDSVAENALPLPKGLQNFGPGLGKMGKPLRDVVVEFERFVKGKDSTINASLFGRSDENSSEVSIERYSTPKPSSPEGFGQFGAIGQRKVSVTNSNALNEPNHSIVSSPRPGPSNVPIGSLGIKAQKTPPLYQNPLANNSLGGRTIQQQPQKTSLLSSPQIEQYRHPNMQKFSTQFYGQFPAGPNYQGPIGPNVQGPTNNFQGQPGPNYQGESGPNPVHLGQNFQNPAQFNGPQNPQFPVSNFRPNGPFMNQNAPIGPMSNMSGPSHRTVAPVQNCTNLGPTHVSAPNTSVPVPASNVPMPVPALRASSGPLPGSIVLSQGPHGLPIESNGQNQGPNGPFQGSNGPHQGPNRSFQGPNGPFQGPNGPFPGPNGPFLGPNGPFQVSNVPFQGPNAPFQGPNGTFQGPNRSYQGPNGPFQGPNGPFQGPNGPFQGPNGPFQGPNGPFHGPNGPSQGQRSLPGVMLLKGKDPVTLQITNLPEQVNFASLYGRLSKVGQVVSLEFTGQGSALVKFDNPSEAERCFQYYSPSRFGHELGLIL